MERRAMQQQRIRRNRRRATSLGVLAMVAVLVVVLLGSSGGSKTSATSTTTTTGSAAGSGSGTAVSSRPSSIEAGVAPWQLPAPVSRPAVVTVGTGFAVLGHGVHGEPHDRGKHTGRHPGGCGPRRRRGLSRRLHVRGRWRIAEHRRHRPVDLHPARSHGHFGNHPCWTALP
jgi:hypothetical protein